MKTICFCFIVIVLLLPVEANVVAEGNEQAEELRSSVTNDTQTREVPVTTESSSIAPSPTDDATRAATTEESADTSTSGSAEAVRLPVGLPSSCVASQLVNRSRKSRTGILRVVLKTANIEDCCNKCRRFDERGMLCRSYHRAEDSKGLCYLYENR
eukprot:g3745.t1